MPLNVPYVAKAGDMMTGPLAVNRTGAANAETLSSDTTPVAGFTTAGGAVLLLQSTDAGAFGATHNFYHNSASPAVSDTVGGFNFFFNNTTPAAVRGVGIFVVATNVTAASESAELAISTIQSGTLGTRFRLGAGLYGATATGSDQGAGTVNATGLFDDGVAVVCMPLNDNAERGSQAFWDGLMPLRIIKHEAEVIDHPAILSEPDILTAEQRVLKPARQEIVKPAETETVKLRHRTAKRYFDMKAQGFDASDPDNYFARMRKDRALPGLPTIEEHERRYPLGPDGFRVPIDKYGAAERTERLQLAIDYMAQTIEAMWQELKALKSA